MQAVTLKDAKKNLPQLVDRVLADAEAHIVHWEIAGAAALCGLQPRPVAGGGAVMDADALRATIRFRPPAGVEPPPGIAEVRRSDGLVEAAPDDLVATLHRLTGWALENGLPLDALEVHRPSLEDVYLSLVGDAGREPDRTRAQARAGGAS